MAHSENIISSIKLPSGTTYEIHDAKAIHDVSDLGLASVLVFKGTKATASEVLALTSAKQGDVWLVTENNAEYVCTKTITATDSTAWEKLGETHNVASSTHTHNVTVTGTNAASSVTGTVTVPTVSVTKKYLTAIASKPEVTLTKDSVLGADTGFTVSGGTATTTKLSATASGTAVGANGTVDAITGFEAHTTDTALGTGATFTTTVTPATSKMATTSIPKVSVSAVSIPNVTDNAEVTTSAVATNGSVKAGTAASWSASVTNGVLEFSWTADNPTQVTLPTFTSVKASKITLGTNIAASKVTTENVTVATGSLSSTGTGSTVVTGISTAATSVNTSDTVTAITALGKPKTATVLTGVKVTAQPTIKLSSGATGDVTVATGVSAVTVTADTADRVSAVIGVDVAAPDITLTNNAGSSTGAVENVSSVTVGTTSASLQNGSAAAQKWTQASGVTGQPK